MNTRFADEPRPTGEIPRQEIERARAMARSAGPDSRSAGDRWRWFRLFWLLVGLSSLLVVWVLLVMRWRAVTHPLTIAIVGIMPLLAIGPLFAGVLGAWWSRNNSLRVAAALTVVPFLYTTSPVNAVVGCGAHQDAGVLADDVFTIYTANVWFEFPGGQPDQIADAIVAEDPDIVFLQEVTGGFLSVLENDSRLDRYQHRTTDVPGLPVEDLVWSKWPLENASFQDLANARLVQATVNSPAGPVIVTPVHLQAPINRGNVRYWTEQHRLLSELDRSTPRILAGDFNATRDHQPFRQLLDSGWTDAHEVRGCGFDATWPSDGRLPMPVMRLDHVLVTDHFEVLDVRLGTPGGSDHLPVITTLRLNQ